MPQNEVILYFSPAGLVVLAPLPGGLHRIVTTVDEAPKGPAKNPSGPHEDPSARRGGGVARCGTGVRGKSSHMRLTSPGDLLPAGGVPR